MYKWAQDGDVYKRQELDNIGKEIAKLNCDYVLFAVTEVLTLIYTCINDLYDLSRKGKRIDFNKFSVMVLEEERCV